MFAFAQRSAGIGKKDPGSESTLTPACDVAGARGVQILRRPSIEGRHGNCG